MECQKFTLKLLLRKSDIFKTLILKVQKVCHKVSFWGALTHAHVIEFLNFLLQLKNQKCESKTVCGFSVIFVMKEIMKSYFLLNKNIKLNKNETELKMEIPTHSFRGMNHGLQLT